MPKVAIPKKSTSVDMTAMCDVSFLLLTFFILTSKFKPVEPVPIDVPTARSETKIDGALTVSVDKDGKAYYSLSDQALRLTTLNNLTERYGDRYPMLKTLTDAQKTKFSNIDVWGAPIEQMPQILSMSDEQLKEVQKDLAGIPIDSVNNQLGAWLMAGRYADNKMKIAIKGDKFTNIKAVQRVIEIFTSNDVHRFNLITTLSGSSDAEAPKAE